MAQYSIKPPDMSRNTALAGQTVRSRGMDVTYDSLGYATKAVKSNNSGLTGSQDTRATRSTGGTGSAYDGSYGSGYSSAYDALRAANEAAVQQAIGRLTAQKTSTNESYDDYARQAYRDKMSAERDIDQYLGARGITGGAAESTILGLNTSYADELRKIEQSRRETLSALDQAITEARLTGDLNNAKAAAEAAKEQASLYAQEMAERKAAAAAQEQYERTEAQGQQSWARTLAGQMLAAGRMPDDATLAAAGITRAQAELLLTQTEKEEPKETNTYTPTFTQSQVYDAAKRGLLTGNMLRDYNYYFYGDPDYSGTAANATQTYTPASSSSSRKSATTTKEEPVDPTLLAQLDAYAERGMTPSGLMELLERWVTEKNISKTQKEQIARSFGC